MKLKKIIWGIAAGILVLGGALGVCIATDVFVSSYTIKFNANGGELVGNEEIEVEKGSTIKLPSSIKEGYTLNGWYNGKEMWTENKVVTSNMTLDARWDLEKYLITFIVDGKRYYEFVEYGSTPSFSGSTHKESTINEQYTFIGWEPSITAATKNAVYEAVYETEVRKYNVNLSLSHTGAGEIVGAGEYEYNTNASFSVTSNNGYEFLGWYNKADDSLFSTETTISISNIENDYDLIAKFKVTTRTITYHNLEGAANSNKTIYDVRDGTISLSPLSRRGYTFLGFYDGEGASANKIERIDSSFLLDYNLYAKWEIISYTITYNLNGGENNALNLNSYTVETATFTLLDPTKADDSFLGWAGTNLTKTTKVVTISKGTTGDLYFSAVWTGGAKIISFVVNGESLDEIAILANPGDRIIKPSINGLDYGMSGYDILNWYTSDGMIYSFSTMPEENITLEGEWEYTINSGFIPYLTKFNTNSHTYASPLQINSYEELVALTEYLTFYDKIDFYYFKLTYKTCTSAQLETEMANALNDCIYPINRVRYTNVYPSGVAYFSFSALDNDVEWNLLDADSENEYTYNQIPSALVYNEESGRRTTYDDFNINKVSNTISVKTSNQLVYALEIGLKPVPESGSPAEKVYNKAKEILRSICSDDMDDVTKARVIYEYLIINVEYDNYAAETSSITKDWAKYDAWYAEGALLNGKAVCDGIAKAYLILAKIENIPTIRINSTDHAWNKIYINGKWYGVDATHGNTCVPSIESEILTYTNFMFTDEYKTGKGNIATNYYDKVADSEYNYYSSTIYKNSSNQEFDLCIDDENEFVLLLNYIKAKGVTSGSEYSIEVIINYIPKSYTFMYNILGVTRYSIVLFEDSLGNEVTCYILTK